MKTVIPEAPGVQTVVALEDGNLITGMVQDCTPILEYTKARHNEGLTGSKDMRLAASIPFFVIEKYCHDNGITFEEYNKDKTHWKRVLNSPDNSMFRIWKGQV